MRALTAFSLCYFPDTLERCADLIFGRMGIESQRTNHRISSDPAREIDIDPEAIRHDLDLYERARERFADPSAEALEPTEAVRRLHAAPPLSRAPP